jgi:hypothetical protein
MITGAAAQIRGQHVEQCFVADIRLALQNAGGKHQEAGGAKAILHAVMHHQDPLQRVQLLTLREPLDRADRASLRLHREPQASADGVAIDQHSASPADAMLTTHMRAGQTAFVTDRIEKGATRLQP